ncbi:MAG: hypothetical protein RL748_3815 [Pseudomonadota bacterium]|jgi:hypothetical protein
MSTLIYPARRPAPDISRSKYRNQRVMWNGMAFDSQAEYERYQQLLLLLLQAKHISNLMRQVSFELAPSVVIDGKPKRALRYVADFQYIEVASGKTIVEDVKGMLTQAYIIKRHLMMSVHGITILETGAKTNAASQATAKPHAPAIRKIPRSTATRCPPFLKRR